MALSVAHDSLMLEQWEGADLAGIAQAILKPHAEGGRVTVDGPAAQVAPNIAIALSMALNELATNALKYGALSAPSGRVRLTWTEADNAVDLEWRESDGPTVTKPLRTGFGSRLLRRGLTGGSRRPPELIFDPGGLICKMHVPTRIISE